MTSILSSTRMVRLRIGKAGPLWKRGLTPLFRRLSRYPRGETNPRENRLTEAFAVVLDRVPGLAAALVEEWTGLSVAGQPLVTTQRPTHSGYFVDLELRFGDARAWPNRLLAMTTSGP